MTAHVRRARPRHAALSLPILLVACGRIGYPSVAASLPDAAVEAPGTELGAHGDGAGDVEANNDMDGDGTMADRDAALDEQAGSDVAATEVSPAGNDAREMNPPAPRPALVRATVLPGRGLSSSHEHEIAPGSNRYLLVGVAIETETVDVVSAAAGLRPLARLGAMLGPACSVVVFGLANPTVGKQQILVTLDATSDVVVTAASFTGVRPSAAPTELATETGVTSPLVLPIASATDELVVDVVCLDHDLAIPSEGPMQTVLARAQTSTFAAAMSSAPGAPETAMLWSFGSGPAQGWAIGALTLEPVR